MRNLKSTVSAALGLIIAGMTAPATPTLAQFAERPESTRDFLQKMDRYFEETLPDYRPETVKGTGFKPYQRIKWFVEPRLGDRDGLIPGARWDAWEKLQEMKAGQQRADIATWFNLGPTNVSGRILAIEVHPVFSDIVFAGSASGGLWKTTNGGDSWSPMTDFLPTLAVGAIEIDSDDPDHMWIGTGEGWGGDFVHGIGVLESHDGGVSWSQTGLQYEVWQGADVFELEYSEGTGTLLCAADTGLWRSTDHGDTWTDVMPTGIWKDVEIQPGATGTYLALVHGIADSGVYRSTDDGQTWVHLTNGLPTAGISNGRIATTAADPDLFFCTMIVSNTKAVYRTTDGGDSWTQRSTQDPTQGWYNLSLAIDQANPDIVYSGGVWMYRSTNGGTSWVNYAGNNMHVDHHATAHDPNDPQTLWFGSDGGCWRTDNGGTTVPTARNNGLVTFQFYAINHSYPDINFVIGGTQDNGTYRYTGSTSWVYTYGGDGFECEVGSNNDDIVWAEIYYGEHYRSTNGGSGMQWRNSGITESGPWQTPTHMDYDDDETVYTGHNSKIFKTTNGGGAWYPVSIDNGLGGGVAIAQCWTQRDNLAVVGGTRVFVSSDRGEIFTQVTNPPVANTISDVAIHPNDPDVMLITTSSYSSSFGRVYRTTDRGLTWSDQTANLPGEPCNTVIFDHDDPDRIYLGSDLGVYASFDGGDHWTPLDVGLPNVVCTDLRWHPAGYLRVGTYGRGAWEMDISGLVPSSTEDVPSGEVIQPLTMRIHGNPATGDGVTTVRFGLREAGPLDVALYDAAGRRLQTLFQGEHDARVDFLPVDTRELSAGIYFVKMSTGSHQISRKLVVER